MHAAAAAAASLSRRVTALLCFSWFFVGCCIRNISSVAPLRQLPFLLLVLLPSAASCRRTLPAAHCCCSCSRSMYNGTCLSAFLFLLLICPAFSASCSHRYSTASQIRAPGFTTVAASSPPRSTTIDNTASAVALQGLPVAASAVERVLPAAEQAIPRSALSLAPQTAEDTSLSGGPLPASVAVTPSPPTAAAALSRSSTKKIPDAAHILPASSFLVRSAAVGFSKHSAAALVAPTSLCTPRASAPAAAAARAAQSLARMHSPSHVIDSHTAVHTDSVECCITPRILRRWNPSNTQAARPWTLYCSLLRNSRPVFFTLPSPPRPAGRARKAAAAVVPSVDLRRRVAVAAGEDATRQLPTARRPATIPTLATSPPPATPTSTVAGTSALATAGAAAAAASIIPASARTASATTTRFAGPSRTTRKERKTGLQQVCWYSWSHRLAATSTAGEATFSSSSFFSSSSWEASIHSFCECACTPLAAKVCSIDHRSRVSSAPGRSAPFTTSLSPAFILPYFGTAAASPRPGASSSVLSAASPGVAAPSRAVPPANSSSSDSPESAPVRSFSFSSSSSSPTVFPPRFFSVPWSKLFSALRSRRASFSVGLPLPSGSPVLAFSFSLPTSAVLSLATAGVTPSRLRSRETCGVHTLRAAGVRASDGRAVQPPLAHTPGASGDSSSPATHPADGFGANTATPPVARTPEACSGRAGTAAGVGTPQGRRVQPVDFAAELKNSFLCYAYSTILSRALPDVRDGLKPVHRRLLFAMKQLQLRSSGGFRKCARVVGEVLGRFHPHGDQAVYDALVRLSQTFVSAHPLIDGHGNFGSIDGDPAAAMRYTECRLSRICEDVLLQDLTEEIVAFKPNFDSTEKEPTVFAARAPLLLVQGSTGIAVGVSTQILPHNLGEVVDATIALLLDRRVSEEELAAVVQGPDFPTGGLLLNGGEMQEAYAAGHGRALLRGCCHVEEAGLPVAAACTALGGGGADETRARATTHLQQQQQQRRAQQPHSSGGLQWQQDEKGADNVAATAEGAGGKRPRGRLERRLVFTELPYNTNKSSLVQLLAQMVATKNLEDVTGVRDETDWRGVRLVLVLRNEASPHAVLQQLLHTTPLQASLPLNIIALDKNARPTRFSLKELLLAWIEFRFETLRRMLRAEQQQREARLHLLQGLLHAVKHSEKLLLLLRSCRTPADAKQALVSQAPFRFSPAQADGLLRLTLGRLTRLEQQQLEEEEETQRQRVQQLERLLVDDAALRDLLVQELQEIKKLHAVPRRTAVRRTPAEARERRRLLQLLHARQQQAPLRQSEDETQQQEQTELLQQQQQQHRYTQENRADSQEMSGTPRMQPAARNLSGTRVSSAAAFPATAASGAPAAAASLAAAAPPAAASPTPAAASTPVTASGAAAPRALCGAAAAAPAAPGSANGVELVTDEEAGHSFVCEMDLVSNTRDVVLFHGAGLLRVPLSLFPQQRRGAVGRRCWGSGNSTKSHSSPSCAHAAVAAAEAKTAADATPTQTAAGDRAAATDDGAAEEGEAEETVPGSTNGRTESEAPRCVADDAAGEAATTARQGLSAPGEAAEEEPCLPLLKSLCTCRGRDWLLLVAETGAACLLPALRLPRLTLDVVHRQLLQRRDPATSLQHVLLPSLGSRSSCAKTRTTPRSCSSQNESGSEPKEQEEAEGVVERKGLEQQESDGSGSEQQQQPANALAAVIRIPWRVVEETLLLLDMKEQQQHTQQLHSVLLATRNGYVAKVSLLRLLQRLRGRRVTRRRQSGAAATHACSGGRRRKRYTEKWKWLLLQRPCEYFRFQPVMRCAAGDAVVAATLLSEEPEQQLQQTEQQQKLPPPQQLPQQPPSKQQQQEGDDDAERQERTDPTARRGAAAVSRTPELCEASAAAASCNAATAAAAARGDNVSERGTVVGLVRRHSSSAEAGRKEKQQEQEDSDTGDVPDMTCASIVLATAGGLALRFPAASVREVTSTRTAGVKGMTLKRGDSVAAVAALTAQRNCSRLRNSGSSNCGEGLASGGDACEVTAAGRRSGDRDARGAGTCFLVAVTAHGQGKRFLAHSLRVQTRGGTGMRIMRLRSEQRLQPQQAMQHQPQPEVGTTAKAPSAPDATAPAAASTPAGTPASEWAAAAPAADACVPTNQGNKRADREAVAQVLTAPAAKQSSSLHSSGTTRIRSDDGVGAVACCGADAEAVGLGASPATTVSPAAAIESAVAAVAGTECAPAEDSVAQSHAVAARNAATAAEVSSAAGATSTLRAVGDAETNPASSAAGRSVTAGCWTGKDRLVSLLSVEEGLEESAGPGGGSSTIAGAEQQLYDLLLLSRKGFLLRQRLEDVPLHQRRASCGVVLQRVQSALRTGCSSRNNSSSMSNRTGDRNNTSECSRDSNAGRVRSTSGSLSSTEGSGRITGSPTSSTNKSIAEDVDFTVAATIVAVARRGKPRIHTKACQSGKQQVQQAHR